jgi:hypothetical protein
MQVNLANLIAAQSARPTQTQPQTPAQAKPQTAAFSAELAQRPEFEALPLAKTAQPRAAVQTAGAGISRPGAQLDITV